MLSHRNLAICSWCYISDVDPMRLGAPTHAAPISHGSGLYGLAHIMKGSCQVIPGKRWLRARGDFRAHRLGQT